MVSSISTVETDTTSDNNSADIHIPTNSSQRDRNQEPHSESSTSNSSSKVNSSGSNEQSTSCLANRSSHETDKNQLEDEADSEGSVFGFDYQKVKVPYEDRESISALFRGIISYAPDESKPKLLRFIDEGARKLFDDFESFPPYK